jgi:type VI secretion system protein ImpM
MDALPPTGTGDSREPPGWYGKLSMLGDFAHRRLPMDFVQRCDTWLSQSMASSREQLGSDWLDVYLSAPVQRFAWAPGVLDAYWWFGVLMPSCDQVGRHFPLLVAQRRARAPQDRIALDHLELWFEHLTQAALQTLHERAALGAFEDALQDAPPWPTPGTTPALAPRACASGQRFALGRTTSLQQAMQALATQELMARLQGASLWWRLVSDPVEPTLSVMQGLPDAAGFAALLQT